MSTYPSVDDLREAINEFKGLLNQGKPTKINGRSLTQLYETTNNLNLPEMREEALQLMENYLTQLKGATLETTYNLNNISDRVERLKMEIGMPNLVYSIIKKIAPIRVNYELRKQGKKAPPEAKEYLADLFVCMALEEEKIKKDIEDMHKVLESEGYIQL